MADRKFGKWLGTTGLLGLSLLSTSMLHAAKTESVATVRPPVESLGPLRGAYEHAIVQVRTARSARALLLPAGFVKTNGPEVLPARLLELATGYAKHPTPEGQDGHPVLSGSWASQNAMIFGVAATNAARSAYDPVDLALALEIPDMRAAATERLVPTNVPSYKPELVAKVRELYSERSHKDSTAKCGWAGVPRIGAPTHIAQAADKIVFLYNDPSGSAWRVIDMTRTSFPEDADSTFNGTSVAHWEGNTLVVVTEYLPRETWFGEYGYFHGPDVKITEKFQRTGDIMMYQVTVEDPSVLTQPWTRDAITLFRADDVRTEPLIQPCTPREADAALGKTALFVTRLY